MHLQEDTKIRVGTAWVYDIAYSPDGTCLVVVSSIGTWLYDAQTGNELDLITGHTDLITNAKFGPDGKTIASGSLDGTICLRDVDTGTHLHTLTWNWGMIGNVSFSPDGKMIAGGSMHGFIGLWDVDTGTHLRTFILPRNRINNHALTPVDNSVLSIGFSPDGKSIVSGSTDETIRLWDADTGQPILTLIGHTGWVISVVFSPDGKTNRKWEWRWHYPFVGYGHR